MTPSTVGASAGFSFGKGSVLDNFRARQSVSVASQGPTALPVPDVQDTILPAAHICVVCTQLFRG
eukprot:4556206-Lingulodinium_polyedra.AAC.1